jgi:hypothetical protein
VIGGRIGREIFGGMFFIYCAALAGSGLLSLSISLNAVSLHALCTAGWVAIVTAIGFGLSSIQTLDKVSWLGWVGMVSILSARECSVWREMMFLVEHWSLTAAPSTFPPSRHGHDRRRRPGPAGRRAHVRRLEA